MFFNAYNSIYPSPPSVRPSVRPSVLPSTHPSPTIHPPVSIFACPSHLPSCLTSFLHPFLSTSFSINHWWNHNTHSFLSLLFLFPLAALHGLQAVSFSTRESIPAPLQWKIRVLTPGHQGIPSACFFHLWIDLEHIPLLVRMDFPCVFFLIVYIISLIWHVPK